MEISAKILRAATGTCCLALLLTALPAGGQAIVSSIEKGGNITINAPAGLAERDNEATKGDKPDKGDKSADDDKSESTGKKTDDGQTQAGRHTTRQTVASRGYGYRIQAYTSSSKQEAQQRARQLAAKFPNYRTYIAFKSPTWRLRVGDFKNHNDAQAAMQRMRAAFPAYAGQMSVVKDHINNWE